MTSPYSERLSAVDAAFLEIEDETCPMHVGRLRSSMPRRSRVRGRVDIDRIRDLVDAVLVPRYRQRIARIPSPTTRLGGRRALQLALHLRHLSLPRRATSAS